MTPSLWSIISAALSSKFGNYNDIKNSSLLPTHLPKPYILICFSEIHILTGTQDHTCMSAAHAQHLTPQHIRDGPWSS